MGSFIKVRGAKVHNLKNINLDIPKEKLVVITGVSGSGKSSLAFDTLYAEGQRRYIESLSAYARQFLGVMQKPEVEKIENINPAIAIEQKKGSYNPRSTVGTTTEIHDYLRLLFARIGVPKCPKCKRLVQKQSVDQIVNQILSLPPNSQVAILAPLVKGRKGTHKELLEDLAKKGILRVRVDGKIYRIEEVPQLDKNKKHNLEAVIDRLILNSELERSRLADSVEAGLKLSSGSLIVAFLNQKKKDIYFSQNLACPVCNLSLPDLEPRLFSFNSPYGACPKCQGLGERLEVDPELVIPNKDLSIAEGAIRPWMRASHRIGRQSYFWWKLEELSQRYGFSLYQPIKELDPEVLKVILYGDQEFEGVIPQLERRYLETDSEYTKAEIEQYMREKVCEACKGKRLRKEALAVYVGGKNIAELEDMYLTELESFLKDFIAGKIKRLSKEEALSKEKLKIALPILKEIQKRLSFLIEVGLGYLSLSRRIDTLSGGEAERVRLATQIGSQLSGVLYILDEPSIGLHPSDQSKLIKNLKALRDLGNTVIVVEHDLETIKNADWVIELGPGAGKEGGKVVFEGTPEELKRSQALTGLYLSGKKKVEVLKKDKPKLEKLLIIKGAKEHNLKNITVKIPLGNFVCVSGVSGSGKSSLVEDILAKALKKHFYNSKEEPGKHDKILGLENIDKVVFVDQSPIGRTPRSNPATYTGVFSYIRDLFSKTKEARARGFKPGRFSFNLKGGRCESCEGQGVKKIEMYFLPDIYVECQDCKGKRYNLETLSITYKGKNIAEVLEMTVREALEFFKNIPPLYQRLKLLDEVGLGYLQLGQPATTLSGGEAQRIKLAAELSKKATGKTFYILDEPTTGLHSEDVLKLLKVLRELVNRGNTVLVVEHNLDVLKNADWIIDLGPGGGEEGGKIVAEGTPKDIAQNPQSLTGKFLKKVLN